MAHEHPKYAVHPGGVPSRHDADLHYIDAVQLARLYQLKPGEYIVWDEDRPETFKGRRKDDYIHLFPQWHYGNYGRPVEGSDVDGTPRR